ncbi:MAG TPA: lysozyme inhibitor LprI family protein [Acidobacteriaceae bacterium]|jgi:uncharacterized protein YecT (DUF1311 family)|nr:lysozyme inhibitor LprI family protein [Acidobacteriaceae bacterium]
MRRVLFITFLLLVASDARADAQQMNAPDSPCKDSVSTVDSANCFYSAYQKSDRKLNDTYAVIRRVLDPNEIDALRSAQRLWLQFRDANCFAEKALYGSGTAVGPVYNACMEAVTRRRVEELNGMYMWRIEKSQSLYPPGPMPEMGNCTKKDSSTRPDCPHAVAFFEKLKLALKSGDRDAVASYVDYPLLINRDKNHDYIQDREALLKNFDHIFDLEVQCVISHYRFTAGVGQL